MVSIFISREQLNGIDEDESNKECENSLRVMVILLNSCPTLCFNMNIMYLFGDLLLKSLKKPLVFPELSNARLLLLLFNAFGH
jgi:hypothetical protein